MPLSRSRTTIFEAPWRVIPRPARVPSGSVASVSGQRVCAKVSKVPRNFGLFESAAMSS
jgi:hypothetical protein